MDSVKERPILFSDEMVRAILEGRKSQTRRVMKIQPISYNGRKYEIPNFSPKQWHDADNIFEFCPYGLSGDRLWVREAFWANTSKISPDPVSERSVIYRATCGHTLTPTKWTRWKPSIHMPRWASRITLEITKVRIERLLDISEEDAIAEGVETLSETHGAKVLEADGSKRDITHKETFGALWEEINGENSWDANPLVWVIEFRRVAV